MGPFQVAAPSTRARGLDVPGPLLSRWSSGRVCPVGGARTAPTGLHRMPPPWLSTGAGRPHLLEMSAHLSAHM
jgi:hypothetical protein